MNRKAIVLISLALVGVIFAVVSFYKKAEHKNSLTPVLTTTAVTAITQKTAMSGGTISTDNGETVTARGVVWSMRQLPTIADNKTIEGPGAGEFASVLNGLDLETTYYLRAYATNRNGTGYGGVLRIETAGSCFTDVRDNNVYQIVSIGNQVWMEENLKYLPSVAGPGTGSDSNTTAYYYVYGYDGRVVADAKAAANYQTYGVLYNWAAAMAGAVKSELNPSGVQGVCPTGWHLPSDVEWEELIEYLGGEYIAGGKLKEIGTTHWKNPNTGATNEVGFAALPSGYRDTDKTFKNIADIGYWWSTTEYYKFDYLAWYPYLSFNLSKVSEISSSKGLGLSVRCVMD